MPADGLQWHQVLDGPKSQVEAFELMGRPGLALALKNIPGMREPLDAAHP